MDNPTPSLSEQGIQALRAGNIDPAVDLLARAVIADPHEAEAQAHPAGGVEWVATAFRQQSL